MRSILLNESLCMRNCVFLLMKKLNRARVASLSFFRLVEHVEISGLKLFRGIRKELVRKGI